MSGKGSHHFLNLARQTQSGNEIAQKGESLDDLGWLRRRSGTGESGDVDALRSGDRTSEPEKLTSMRQRGLLKGFVILDCQNLS